MRRFSKIKSIIGAEEGTTFDHFATIALFLLMVLL